MTAVPKDEAEYRKEGNWRFFGVVYFAPGDSRAFVPKRSWGGLPRAWPSITINFAQPEAQAWFGAQVGLLAWVLVRSRQADTR
mmetsp:Transcript_14221/g.20671  ORF Transcript_14221/g.20671 Transcript_14221/m.20671 type:complete len:83 (-) Transcript_14221:1055-1303(-)